MNSSIDLLDHIAIPNNYQDGLLKCRVLYNGSIKRIEIAPYQINPINSLTLVYDDLINYAHKWVDRTALAELYHTKGKSDDILIVKNGLLTDSYYCNVALSKNGKWYTPAKPLLKGVRRAQLLSNSLIIEEEIHHEDLQHYDEIRLFNAMIEFGEISLSTRSIFEI